MAKQYNNPAGGTPSSVGTQLRTDFFKRRAMVEVAEEMFFGQFTDTLTQPKHYGKKVVMYQYLPILHDANLTDQGIDANGVSTVRKVQITIVAGGAVKSNAADRRNQYSFGTHYAVGEGATDALALTAAQAAAEDVFKNLKVFNTDYATTKTALEALPEPWTITENAGVPATGNLYGSSRDVGYVTGKLPVLSETGGRVNRVGNTRVKLESTMSKLGIFEEYTEDSYQFDSDADLEMHCHREMLRAANEIGEDALQLDLLAAPGIIRYGGDATSVDTLTGETGSTPSLVTYDDLMRLDIDLNNVRAPKTITAVTGSTNVDTRTVQSARPLLVGSELIPTLKSMVDNHGNPAFKYLHEYQDGDNKPLLGEIGAIDAFRIIVVPRMMYDEGKGATVTNNGGYRETNGKYDVFPMLVISKGAFSEIGFRSAHQAGNKWQFMHKKPGMSTMDYRDPYGQTGRMSIQFWYGSLVGRPEHIAVIKTVAKL